MDYRFLLPEIEAAAVRGWPALEQVPVDGWLWRHSSGGSIRGNSVATLSYSGNDIARSISAVEQLCRSRDLRASFTISDVTQPRNLDEVLAARDYARGQDHITMAKAVDAAIAWPADVDVSPAASQSWMDVYLSGLSNDRRDAAPRILQGLPPSARYLCARFGTRVISCGLTISDGAFASVQCMASSPDSRRMGGARRVLQAIESLALQNGQRALYVQTGSDNLGAQIVYRRQGFAVIGTYHTRSQPA